VLDVVVGDLAYRRFRKRASLFSDPLRPFRELLENVLDLPGEFLDLDADQRHGGVLIQQDQEDGAAPDQGEMETLPLPVVKDE